jgi:phage terminase large subunit-like protein
MTIEIQPQTPSQSSALLSIKGHQKPRLWTPPQLDVYKPENSYGHNVIEFGKLIGLPLDPWQEDLVIQLGELSHELDDKGNRVPLKRRVLINLPRQNGKTLLVELLSLYWMFVEKHPLILGMNANLSDALDVMTELSELAHSSELLAPLIRRTKEGNTDPKFQTKEGSTYKPVAATEKGGRGKRAQRAVIDELRLQKDWKAYNAAIPAMSAQKNAQAIFITNAGFDNSVVLNSLRAAALEYIDTGSGDPHLAIYEWSAPDGADIYDPNVWAIANPSLNIRKTFIAMQGEAAIARTGSTEEANFRTEHLCQHVKAMDSAVDADKWKSCYVDSLDWSGLAKRSVLFLDIAGNSKRATLVAAYTREDGKTQLGILKEWRDENAMSQLEADLEAILKKNKPRAFGWMPIGPAAAKATLKNLKVPGIAIEQYTGEVADACMTFADLVRDAMVVHSSDTNDLLSLQVTSAAKKHQGDRWKFDRKGGNYDAALAAAGAVLLARSLPPRKTARLIGPDDGQEDE